MVPKDVADKQDGFRDKLAEMKERQNKVLLYFAIAAIYISGVDGRGLPPLVHPMRRGAHGSSRAAPPTNRSCNTRSAPGPQKQHRELKLDRCGACQLGGLLRRRKARLQPLSALEADSRMTAAAVREQTCFPVVRYPNRRAAQRHPREKTTEHPCGSEWSRLLRLPRTIPGAVSRQFPPRQVDQANEPSGPLPRHCRSGHPATPRPCGAWH
jgi:hypothetical protein